MEPKKKVSRFELALMQVIDPERSKEYEAFTESEMRQKQEADLRKQLDNMQIVNGEERKDISEEDKDKLINKFLK